MKLISDDELCHHGIIGQKWGVRRYQNKDGTLTAAGKKRYSLKQAIDKIDKEKVKYFVSEASKHLIKRMVTKKLVALGIEQLKYLSPIIKLEYAPESITTPLHLQIPVNAPSLPPTSADNALLNVPKPPSELIPQALSDAFQPYLIPSPSTAVDSVTHRPIPVPKRIPSGIIAKAKEIVERLQRQPVLPNGNPLVYPGLNVAMPVSATNFWTNASPLHAVMLNIAANNPQTIFDTDTGPVNMIPAWENWSTDGSGVGRIYIDGRKSK